MSGEGNNSNNQYLFTGLLIVLAACLLFLSYTLFSFLPDKRVEINNQKIDVIVADTSSEREKGLSGRDRLSDREGMLFVFSNEDEYCFWMKDMKIPIDIIWLNANKQVVDIKSNATPDSYPNSFCPDKPATYVLEVNSGKTDEWQITNGDSAEF